MVMQSTYKRPGTVWLRTDRPVVPLNDSLWWHLPEVEDALHNGVAAIADAHRREFYEFETAGNWYYIHVPTRITGVYLVAARPKFTAVNSSPCVAECVAC